ALAASATRSDVMRNVARAAVPMLGDWCSIHVLRNDDSGVPDTAIAHVDSANLDYLEELQERFPYDPSSTTGIPQVIRTGVSQFYPHIDDQIIAEAELTDEGRRIARALALRSAIAVPLIKHGRV